ncbi:hypothetical protein CesoFtcFv8_013661 [Champsocephalus esox]|uniref:C-type lectin domain-containing protein n=1 Tax=Champsocephalus esox TaxID=159716 RepID=A0AAN8BS31_9TELE|nr:hypothetical protein CesoFtcFv8_013661 [Champsocephalus esox]
MKALALLALSLAVALGRPPFDSRVAPNPVLTGDNQSPLLGDWVPVQGHVVVEDPAPQVRPRFEEQQVQPAPVNLNPEVKAEVKVDVKPDVEMEPELSNNPDFKVESKVQEEESEENHIDMEEKYELVGEPIIQQEPLDEDNVSEANQNQDPVNQRLSEEEEGLLREKAYVLDGEPTMELENQQVEDVPELSDNPDFKVESEVKVEPDVETEERHIDMEDTSEMAGKPIMEMEPLDDDDMSEEELSDTEKSLRKAFQHQDPVNQYLSEVEGGLMRERTYILDGEPIMELENEPVEDVPELSDNPDFKVESEVKVEPDVETEERHIDMEDKSKMAGKPIMEMEPLDDDDMSEEELSNTEKSLRAAFQHQDPVNQYLSEVEEGLMRERTYILDGEPIMELENEPVEDVSELSDNPDFKVESEVQETETKLRDIDMEKRYEIVGEPIMELEPLEDDDISKEELSEMELLEVERSLRRAYQNQNVVNQRLSEEEEGLIRENTYVLDGEPILELEPLEIKVQENFEEEGEEGRENDIERKYEIVGRPIMELEPLEDDNEAQKEFPVQMNLEEETQSNQETEEKHIDMEARYEMVGEPIMEPLDYDNMHGEKLSSRSEVNTEIRYEMVGEPIMELEPLENKDTEQTEEEGGPALDIFGQPMKTSEEYFPNEEARMGSPMEDGSNYLMMDETASEFFQTDQMSPMAADSPVINHGREPRALRRQAVNSPEERRSSPKHNKQGQSCSAGVMIEGKCYQFFKEPKKAADAEFFCQDHFSGGHLASISSPHVHREVMNLIRQNGGLTRTWVGGLRYLETGRFIWLDGSHWGFADWLSGEPNNTSDLEDCVELLPQGNGKFNDFTCWEPQAFVCSY